MFSELPWSKTLLETSPGIPCQGLVPSMVSWTNTAFASSPPNSLRIENFKLLCPLRRRGQPDTAFSNSKRVSEDEVTISTCIELEEDVSCEIFPVVSLGGHNLCKIHPSA